MIPPKLSSSITECRIDPYYGRMVPFDGQGYGKSMNWHYLALRIANKNGEKCDHLDKSNIFDIDNVRIMLTPISDGFDSKIKFNVTCNLCEKLFILTSQKLTNKFIKFYGM